VDANGTRYQLLLGEGDWGGCREGGAALSNVWNAMASPASPPVDSSFYWDPNRNELKLWPLLYAFPGNKDDRALQPSDRRGAAADRFGNFYVIDPTCTRILVCSSGDQTITTFWPPDTPPPPAPRGGAFGPVRPAAPPAARTLSGLAVTTRHYLVVGAVEPGALLVFDLYEGGAPRVLLWPDGVPFAPFDVAPSPAGGVFVLDRDNKRYWELDASFAVCSGGQGSIAISGGAPDAFQPLAGGRMGAATGATFPQGNLLGSASPLSASDPVAIEGLAPGRSSFATCC